METLSFLINTAVWCEGFCVLRLFLFNDIYTLIFCAQMALEAGLFDCCHPVAW